MKSTEYPLLHCSANSASHKAQRLYFRVLGLQLSLFALVSAIGVSLSVLDDAQRRTAYECVAVILVLGILAIWYMREQKVDQRWFNGRSIAESSKTATWRYMMRSRPFDGEIDIDKQFILELGVIRRARPGMEPFLLNCVPDGPEITDHMRQVRQSSLEMRKDTYLRERLDDQIEWYGSKSIWNRRCARGWFWGITGLQLAAVVLAIVGAVRGPFRLNFVSVVMTIAAGFTAWVQARRHDELTTSYAVAEQELRQIRALIVHSNSEAEFIELVDQGEEAVSREHTMWCARRSISSSSNKGGQR